MADVASHVSQRHALLLVGLLSAVCLSVIALAPAAVVLTLMAGIAAAWCVWLEKHPEGPGTQTGER